MFDLLSLQRWDLAQSEMLSSITTTQYQEQIQVPSTSSTMVSESFHENEIEQSAYLSPPNPNFIPPDTSFEQLLLNFMKESETNIKTTRRKITEGCTVITSDEAIAIMKEKQNLKKKTNKNVSKVIKNVKIPKKKIIKKMEICSEDSNTDDNENNVSFEEPYKIGDFVIIKYEEEYFPGVVNDTNTTSALVSVMAMSGSNWNWPTEDDELWYPYEDIIELIRPPKFSKSNCAILVPEMAKYRN